MTTKIANVRQGVSLSGPDWVSPGFGTPQAAIFLCPRAAVDDTQTTFISTTFGFTDGVNQYCANWSGQHLPSSSRAYFTVDNRLGYVMQPTLYRPGYTDNEWGMRFDSFIADGVRTSLTGTPTSDYKGIMQLWNGLNNVAVGRLTLDGGLGTFTANLGWEPDFVIWALSKGYQTPTANQSISIGASANNNDPHCFGYTQWNETDSAYGDAQIYVSSRQGSGGIGFDYFHARTKVKQFDYLVTAYTSNGFSVTVQNGTPDQHEFIYFAGQLQNAVASVDAARSTSGATDEIWTPTTQGGGEHIGGLFMGNLLSLTTADRVWGSGPVADLINVGLGDAVNSHSVKDVYRQTAAPECYTWANSNLLWDSDHPTLAGVQARYNGVFGADDGSFGVDYDVANAARWTHILNINSTGFVPPPADNVFLIT